jgi:hypothetical protein
LVSFFASCQGEVESMLLASFLASGGSLSAIFEMVAFTAVFCHAWHQWRMQKCVSGCECVMCNLQYIVFPNAVQKCCEMFPSK